MSGLDGLTGAEERIINGKPKISDNVVRASLAVGASKPPRALGLEPRAAFGGNTGQFQRHIGRRRMGSRSSVQLLMPPIMSVTMLP